MKEPKNLTESKTSKPPKTNKPKVWNMQETNPNVFEAPKDLEEFQRPEVVKLENLEDFVHGYYEGLQPVHFQTGQIGYLLLLRQGLKTTDKLIAINAGYDIRRWLAESGFDSLLGSYLKITLDKFVNTGKPAPMKQYRYGYTTDVAKQLMASKGQTLAKLEAKYNDGVKLLNAAKEDKSVEVYDDK